MSNELDQGGAAQTHTREGEVVVVTGGASGIGLAVAARFLAEGASVAVIDRQSSDALAALEEEYASPALQQCCSWQIDVTDSKAVDLAMDEAVKRFGKLDVLVACAGVGSVSPILQITDSEWQRVLDINLSGLFYCVRSVAQKMVSASSGNIVVITSAYGERAGYGLASYSAAKSGATRLVEAAALELGDHNIRVNAIAPGVIVTPLNVAVQTNPVTRNQTLDSLLIKRLGDVADVSALVLFLSGPQASYITGQCILVDGGMMLKGPPDIKSRFVSAANSAG